MIDALEFTAEMFLIIIGIILSIYLLHVFQDLLLSFIVWREARAERRRKRGG